MRCEACHGRGYVWRGASDDDLVVFNQVPCPECGGCGVGHCCDGLQANEPALADKTPGWRAALAEAGAKYMAAPNPVLRRLLANEAEPSAPQTDGPVEWDR